IRKNASDDTQLSFDNWLGPQTTLRATGSVTGDDKDLKAGFEKRALWGGSYYAGGDLIVRRWNEPEFNLAGGGADLYAGRQMTPTVKLYTLYRLNRLDVNDTDSASDPDFSRRAGKNITSAASINLSRSTLNCELYPTTGSQVDLTAESAFKALGADYNFSRYEANAALYRTPVGKITLAAHFKAGWVQGFGTSDGVPFFERYFVGSSSTVRGFKWGTAGLSSAQGTPLGGNILLLGSLEARFPLYKKLQGALFFDSGRTFSKVEEVSHLDLREGAGFGLRYLTPWFVARADCGFAVDRRNEESAANAYVTIGLPF
ncbi:MAG: BamA/TamA family outer membrane protein, partial [Candidatus Omnitrophota bacterium]